MSVQQRRAGGWTYVTVCPHPDAPVARQAEQVYAELLGAVGGSDTRVVQERIYGSLSVRSVVLSARDAVWHGAALPPPTYIGDAPCAGAEGLAGVHVVAVDVGAEEPATAVDDVLSAGRPCGRAVRRGDAEFIYIADAGGYVAEGANGLPRAAQAEAAFDAAMAILASRGLSLQNVVRTWVHLEDILDWYGEFNKARDVSFRRAGLLGRDAPVFLPASTGIEGCSAQGLACALDLVAVRRTEAGYPRTWTLSNPRQSEAYSYGSSFSRGACVEERDVTQIYVSGTAAIDDEGRSVCLGDVQGQVEYTLRNVETLLGQAGAGLGDICEATVFFKHSVSEDDVRSAMARPDLANVPAVVVRADVCRDDLLFEIDAGAMISTPTS